MQDYWNIGHGNDPEWTPMEVFLLNSSKSFAWANIWAEVIHEYSNLDAKRRDTIINYLLLQ